MNSLPVGGSTKEEAAYIVKCFARHFGKIIYDHHISFQSPIFPSLTCSANQFFLNVMHLYISIIFSCNPLDFAW